MESEIARVNKFLEDIIERSEDEDYAIVLAVYDPVSNSYIRVNIGGSNILRAAGLFKSAMDVDSNVV